MKINLGIFIAPLVLLAGCKHQISHSEDKSDSRRQRETEFHNKLACKSFEKELAKDAPSNHADGSTTLVDSVFYSSKENTCLLAERTIYLKSNKEMLEIQDVLSNRELWVKQYDQVQDALSAELTLHNQIDEMR